MKRFAQYFLLSIFVTALTACVPVPVVVDSQGTGYSQPVYTDQYDYDDYGYGYDQDYYEVPVVYGEPVYYPPPVSVTFTYDYYTYEIVGGYVDVVFWRGGHRYRHEPWYDQGRRITPGHIHSREFRHKIRGSELYQHRKSCVRNIISTILTIIMA